MKYIRFEIDNYRGISEKLTIDLEKSSLIPLIGINECGKTTILQAIYCFDYVNDEEYNKDHLTNILNLYKTSDVDLKTVTATIEFKQKELVDIAEKNNIEEETKFEEAKKATKSYSPKLINIDEVKKLSTTRMRIQRNLITFDYSFLDEEFNILKSVIKTIIRHSPYILYNDDFKDRPPNSIDIPETKPPKLTDWLAIFERLFNSNNYSLFEIIKESEDRRIMSIISDVEETLNKRLSKAWKTFSLSTHKSLYVKLNLKDKKLTIAIVEKIGNNKERYFNVADRSKGFLWFYNFVMKLEFNPKVIGDAKDTVFLLDEPGSYLHSTAQEKLCKKIKDISENDGNVIYCTHSHHLLNPEIIKLNQICIVEKKSNKSITATPLTKMTMVKETINAYQPIFEALHIPAFTDFYTKNKIILVEGIYDRYAIFMFCDLNDDTFILPGTSADSIIKNLQLVIGFSKKYIAIWDNDEEGKEKYQKASKLFGEYEAKFFDMLPLINKKKRKMEQMFENKDLEKIGQELSLPDNSSYEKIILELYYSKKRNKVINSISDTTKKNFSILSEIIKKRFNQYGDE
jgi:ABC-type cobalamin/Fe3+-siderophores transport system ATPase subunit